MPCDVVASFPGIFYIAHAKKMLTRAMPATFRNRRACQRILHTAGRADTSNINAACEVASAMESESILAALREANFERLEREAAEAAAVLASENAEKLRTKLKASQKEVAALKETIAAAAAEAKLRPSAEALHKAQVRLHA